MSDADDEVTDLDAYEDHRQDVLDDRAWQAFKESEDYR